jgi:hypothetical protein
MAVQIHATEISKSRNAGKRRRTTPSDEIHKDLKGQKKRVTALFPMEIKNEKIGLDVNKLGLLTA